LLQFAVAAGAEGILWDSNPHRASSIEQRASSIEHRASSNVQEIMDHATRTAPPLSVYALWSWDDKVKRKPKLEWLQQYCSFFPLDSITKQALDTYYP